jgi:hypothetical protein
LSPSMILILGLLLLLLLSILPAPIFVSNLLLLVLRRVQIVQVQQTVLFLPEYADKEYPLLPSYNLPMVCNDMQST